MGFDSAAAPRIIDDEHLMGVTIMKTVSALLAGVTLAVALTASFSASAQDTIKIGEINSYSGLPSFTEASTHPSPCWEPALMNTGRRAQSGRAPRAASTARSSR